MKNGKLQVGIIGCGGIANQKHFVSLQGNADKADLVAFCDVIEARAQESAVKYGVPEAKTYTDYRELLADPDIDVVHVLTPNVSHAPITIAAFEAGKHVLCEKPMAATASDAEQMMTAWKSSGKKFTVGYQNRFRPEVQSLHKACANGELGEIYYAEANAIRRRGVPTWGVFPDKAQQGGGPLIDIGTHALDMTLWMMDNYEPASATGSVFYKLGGLQEATDGNIFGPWDPATYEVEDSAFGFVKMANGATIVIRSSWAINLMESREASTTLCGTKAGAEVRSGMSFKGNELHYNRGHNGILSDEKMSGSGAVAYFSGQSADPGFLEAKQWLEAVIDDTEPLVHPEEAFTVTKILDAIYRSAETGAEVKF